MGYFIVLSIYFSLSQFGAGGGGWCGNDIAFIPNSWMHKRVRWNELSIAVSAMVTSGSKRVARRASQAAVSSPDAYRQNWTKI